MRRPAGEGTTKEPLSAATLAAHQRFVRWRRTPRVPPIVVCRPQGQPAGGRTVLRIRRQARACARPHPAWGNDRRVSCSCT